MKFAIKKATSSSLDIDMVLLCLRATPIDHTILSPGELQYNRNLVSNIPLKCANHFTQNEGILARLYQIQAEQKTYDQHTIDLPNLQIG